MCVVLQLLNLTDKIVNLLIVFIYKVAISFAKIRASSDGVNFCAT